MLENANEIILHGFAYKDFLREIPNPQVGTFALISDQVHAHMTTFVLSYLDCRSGPQLAADCIYLTCE